jgi:hypothetical protein
MHVEFLRSKYRRCDYTLLPIGRIPGKAEFRRPLIVAERDSLIQGILKRHFICRPGKNADGADGTSIFSITTIKWGERPARP